MKLRSPALQRHVAAGARVLDWGGWQGPAMYTSLDDEVGRVRNGVGLADYPFLSHQLEGPDALETLQRLCTRDLAQCPPGRSCYTLMLDNDGRPVDDGIVLRLAPERFVVTVPGRKPSSLPANAGFFDVKRPKPWLAPDVGARVAIYDLGAFTMSVQGPHTPRMLASVVDFDRFPPWSVAEAKVGDIPVLCVRTGYSGERGIELLVWPEYALELWDRLVALGQPYDARPFGLEATMTLGREGISERERFLSGLDAARARARMGRRVEQAGARRTRCDAAAAPRRTTHTAGRARAAVAQAAAIAWHAHQIRRVDHRRRHQRRPLSDARPELGARLVAGRVHAARHTGRRGRG